MRPTSKRILGTVLFLSWTLMPQARPTAAPVPLPMLPHGIPDLCAGSADNVRAGQTVTLAGPQVKRCLGIHGTLIVTGDLTVDTILGYEGSSLTVRAGASITIRDTEISLHLDPEQYGTGILSFGQVRMAGTPKTSFVRLAAEPRAGQTTLKLAEAPTGWRSGDRLLLPDTRQLAEPNWARPTTFQWDEPTIAGVSGTTVTLTAPLAFDHLGARNEDGTIRFLPHVANVTRDIVIRSENAAGTRGHLLFTHRADVDIRHVEFRDLGRTTVAPLDSTSFDERGVVSHVGTNQIGKYALHMHHLMGPSTPQANGRQFTLEGNAIVRTSKWAIAVHNAHYGLVRGNVMDKCGGACFMAEDGSETENIIERNLAVRSFGEGGREGGGREGGGFYLRGPLNRVRDNVAANIYSASPDSAYPYKYFFTYLGTIRTPVAQGSDEYIEQDGNGLAIREFRQNEAYASEAGLSYWWVGSFDREPRATETSVFDKLTVWHVFNKGIFNYPSYKITIRDFVAINDYKHQSALGVGFVGGDYMVNEFRMENPEIRHFALGIAPGEDHHGPMPQVYEGGFLSNTWNFGTYTLSTSSFRADKINPVHIEIRGIRFDTPMNANPVFMDGVKSWLHHKLLNHAVHNFIQTYAVDIFDFNGRVGDNFRWYFPQQDPAFVLPPTQYNDDDNQLATPPSPPTPKLLAAPVPGLTNAQAWQRHRIAYAGAVTPCATTVRHVSGFACATAPTAPPPVEICGNSIDDDGDGQIDEGCAVNRPLS